MAEKTWDEFYPEITPFVSGCPHSAIDRELRNICIEFLRDTASYRVEHTAIDLLLETSDYLLTPPALTNVEQVVEAYVLDEADATARPISPVSISTLKKLYSNWRNEVGSPRQYLHDLNALSITLFPKPPAAVASGLLLWHTATPAQVTSTGIPDYLYERYLQRIAAGVLARLQAQPDKRWTDHNQAALHQGLFRRGKVKTQIEITASFGPSQMQILPRNPLA